MSLRLRLVLTIASIVLVGLVAAGGFAWLHATRTVRTEMEAALIVGRRIAENALAQAGGRATATDTATRIVSTLDQDRHLRASLLAEDGSLLTFSALQPSPEPAPAWFADLIRGDRLAVRIPLSAPPRTILLETDPTNEIGEVWGELEVSAAVMATLGVLTLALVYWMLGRSLAPLESLSRAFLSVGSGDYSAKISESGPPELTRLARGFNAMAQRLSTAEAQGRRLDEQITAVQEEERAELARDLHDDVGPYLLAINIDASRIATLAVSRGDRELGALIRSIQDGTQHIQKQVRAILARLRPPGLEELGLVPALQALAAFWRSRHPAIAIAIDAHSPHDFGPAVDDVIYRIVRESLGNAIRHGKPRRIELLIVDDDHEIRVTVRDDGGGLAAGSALGFGVRGMTERVEALGGTLTIANRIEPAGVAIEARLPRVSQAMDDMLTVPA